MESVIVCVAPDLLSLDNVLNFTRLNKIHESRKHILYYLEFTSKRNANVYFANDLVKPELMTRDRYNMIMAGRLNEYNIGDVNLTIRTGSERDQILRFVKSCPHYVDLHQ